jgi:hypothetical protein
MNNINDKPADATQNNENNNIEANPSNEANLNVEPLAVTQNINTEANLPKEESLNEVFNTKPFETLEVIKDIAREPVQVSMKAKYVALVEGKNYEISVKGSKVYDSKSKGNISFEEGGILIERTMIPYSGLTLRLK